MSITVLDVSRPTVRQAVASLRTEGLLDAQQRRGTFVRTQPTAGHTHYPRTAPHGPACGTHHRHDTREEARADARKHTDRAIHGTRATGVARVGHRAHAPP
ncbi:GntR family transcriptional regulator [Streptacidiphilus melanogenes]|uniref:GntR family transcriptional regulator n=1 Tax=Streptacidiphilus melanogenes TaxID=411235 RepID=UPI00136493FF